MTANYKTLTEFASEIGISRQAVHKAYQAERFSAEDINGNLFVDTTNKLVIEYAEAERENKQESGKSKVGGKLKKTSKKERTVGAGGRKTSKKINPVSDPADIPAYLKDIAESSELTFAQLVNLSKAEVDKIKSYEQIKSIRVKTQRDRKELLERKLVRVVFGKLYEIHTNEFLTIKSKIIPDLAGIFGCNDAAKMLEAEKRLDEELWKTLKHIKLILNRFLKSNGNTEI